MRRRRGQHDEDEVPWASFSDALTGLLFVFIALTAVFVWKANKAQQKSALAEEQYSEELARLKGAHERAVKLVTPSDPRSIAACLQGKLDAQSVAVTQGETREGEPNERLSILFTPNATVGQTTTALHWFDTSDARLRRPEACEVARHLGACITEIMAATKDDRILLSGDKLRVFVEGHTDKDRQSDSRFPSNWELSGARAAAVVRAMTMDEPGGDCPAVGETAAALQMAINAEDLDIVASGRAEQSPSVEVICAREPEIAECKRNDPKRDGPRAVWTTLSTPKERIEWANGSVDRMALMRRVELRIEVQAALNGAP